MLTSATIILTVALVVWCVQRVIRDHDQARLRVAEHDRRTASLAADFASALDALRALAPAPALVGHRVTINTKHGEVFHGIIDSEWVDRVRLTDAHMVTPTGKRPVPGGVVSLARADEAFRQEHGQVEPVELRAA